MIKSEKGAVSTSGGHVSEEAFLIGVECRYRCSGHFLIFLNFFSRVHAELKCPLSICLRLFSAMGLNGRD